MKRRDVAFGLGLVVAVGIGVWAWTSEPDRLDRPVASTSAPAVSVVATPAAAARARPDPWQSKRKQVRAARALRLPARPAADPTDDADRCTESCWGTVQLQLRLADAVGNCRELLPAEADGEARFEAHVLAEPGVGAVVDSVDVTDDTLDAEEFTRCITEAAMLAELVEPDEPVADTFVFRYSAGPKRDNAADFLGDHPELMESYPELAALLQPSDDPQTRSHNATTFATIISTDETALAAFSEWTANRGLDLAHVRHQD